jgi:glycosyltransferase involved in cell wall biosynthesis
MYHTRMLPKSRGSVRYRPWTAHNWERVLVKSDIGVEIKSLDDAHLQRKPSTKILTYMAAGLPVVCTPSAADRLVIEHGKTGYFACTDEEWYTYLKALAENPGFRQQMGQAGREYVSRHFNIPKIAQKYLDFFDALIKEANEHTKRKKQTVSKRNQ